MDNININIGIDIGGTKLIIIGSNNISIRFETGKEFTIDLLEKSIHNFIQKTEQNKYNIQIISVGIAICGLIQLDGTIGICECPLLTGYNIKSIIKYILNDETIPISIINDSEAALYKCINSYPNVNNMAVIVAGTGIGSSFFVNGKVVEGHKKLAGQFGMIPIKVCENNKSTIKMLDEIAGGRSLLKKIDMDINSILDILDNKNEDTNQKKIIINCMKDASIALGNSISSIICILNPELIILSGGLMNFKVYKETVLQTIKDNMSKTFSDLKNSYKIIIHPKYNELVALGALESGKNLINN
jgi:glucokinase